MAPETERDAASPAPLHSPETKPTRVVGIEAAQDRDRWGLAGPALGLSLGGTHDADQQRDHRRWVDLAESLGLHSIWLPEMHFQRGVCSAPLVELAGYAARTRRLRLATTSLLLPLHPPERLANEIAQLDQLSGGRLLIGLGRGFQRSMLEAFGVPPAEKRDRFDEALDRILAAWQAPERAGVATPARTHQRPHPPLAVAAFGPKGLAQAARRDLPYLASPVETFDQIAENQALHRAGRPDPTRPGLSLVMRTIFVSDDPDECARARRALESESARPGRGLPAAARRALEAPLSARAVIGSAAQVTERLRHERARLGIDLLVARPQIRGLANGTLETSLGALAESVWPAVCA